MSSTKNNQSSTKMVKNWMSETASKYLDIDEVIRDNDKNVNKNGNIKSSLLERWERVNQSHILHSEQSQSVLLHEESETERDIKSNDEQCTKAAPIRAIQSKLLALQATEYHEEEDEKFAESVDDDNKTIVAKCLHPYQLSHVETYKSLYDDNVNTNAAAAVSDAYDDDDINNETEQLSVQDAGKLPPLHTHLSAASDHKHINTQEKSYLTKVPLQRLEREEREMETLTKDALSLREKNNIDTTVAKNKFVYANERANYIVNNLNKDESKLNKDIIFEPQETVVHREKNQFYNEVSIPQYDRLSNVKKMQNAEIFENNINNMNTEVDDNNNNNNNNSNNNSNNNNSNSNNRNDKNNDEMKDNFIERGLVHCITSELRLVLFALLLLLALVFTIASLPTSQLDVKNNACYTYWGYKENCDDNSHYTPLSLLACTSTRWQLQIASAFAVATLVILIIIVGMSEFMIFCNTLFDHSHAVMCKMRVYAVIMSGMCIICQLIAWAFIVAIYTLRDCDNVPMAKRNITYGVGFGLSVTSWCLVTSATTIFLIMPYTIHCAA